MSADTSTDINAIPAAPPATPEPRPSLPEVFRSVPLPKGGKFWRRLLAFVGPGYLVAVGYMDPGNWATDLQGGARFGYTLLSVIVLSSILAVFLQSLAAKLGLVTGRDLAQACREAYPRPVGIFLWLSAEIAIVACDIAEVIGAGIALYLLFKLPLIIGCAITAADVLLVLGLQGRGWRLIEAIVVALIAAIIVIFAIEIFWAQPNWAQVGLGALPHPEILANKSMLYIALGILGATVMPHNLYLHSSIVQTRATGPTEGDKREAVRMAQIDSLIALTLALLVNAAILILAASAFHRTGHTGVGQIEDAYKLLTPLLGAGASTLFAVALLASGQNSTLTGTLAGQIIMEGFVNIRLAAWQSRMIARLLAIVPTLVIVGIYGMKGVDALLVFSQVVLSAQLSFAVFPLIHVTSDRKKMGVFVNGPVTKVVGWTAAAVILGLNVYLIANSI